MKLLYIWHTVLARYYSRSTDWRLELLETQAQTQKICIVILASLQRTKQFITVHDRLILFFFLFFFSYGAAPQRCPWPPHS